MLPSTLEGSRQLRPETLGIDPVPSPPWQQSAPQPLCIPRAQWRPTPHRSLCPTMLLKMKLLPICRSLSGLSHLRQ
jgi:hypothetical protein